MLPIEVWDSSSSDSIGGSLSTSVIGGGGGGFSLKLSVAAFLALLALAMKAVGLVTPLIG